MYIVFHTYNIDLQIVKISYKHQFIRFFNSMIDIYHNILRWLYFIYYELVKIICLCNITAHILNGVLYKFLAGEGYTNNNTMYKNTTDISSD